jgi:transglutaminase-like putative cysteine protease
MIMKSLFLRTLLVCTTILAATTARAYAQEPDFDTSYNIDYEIDNSLVVSVKETIGVINQNASSIPSSFVETITNISVYDIKALDAKDKEIRIETEIKEGQKETVIRVPIENPAVGKDKKTQVTLFYKTKDLAGKTGRILNLHIPKAPLSNFMQEYNVRIKIPRGFGPQITVTPAPVEEKMEEEGYVLLYNKQTLEKYGISASFGDYQIFDFELEYNLKNDSFLAKNMGVTLPMPIENYQEVSLSDITPKPSLLKRDGDGNIIASFKVPGKKSLTVKVTGKANVYTREGELVNYGSDSTIPDDLDRFIKPQPYWEVQDKTILDLALSITSKDRSVTQNALGIYTYLTKNIAYDFEKAKDSTGQDRKGALQTLADKKGLCLDFTDLFIALSRSEGIPAREVDGYAYAKDFGTTPTPQDGEAGTLLHSWAQYYSPQAGWVLVDPTWGATSGLDFFSRLDNNHLAFAIKGLSSQGPQPAAKFNVNFSNDDFFNRESIYDLENLPQEGVFTVTPPLAAGFVLGLGLCTTLILLIAHSRRHYR